MTARAFLLAPAWSRRERLRGVLALFTLAALLAGCVVSEAVPTLTPSPGATLMPLFGRPATALPVPTATPAPAAANPDANPSPQLLPLLARPLLK